MNMNKWRWLLVIIVSVLWSCSGHITIERHMDGLPQEIPGIPFRLTETQIEYSAYLTHMEEDKIGWACEPSLLPRIIENAPSADWYTISYQPAPFEKHKFSVTLNANGTLSSVNTESTPVGPQEIAEAAEKFDSLSVWALLSPSSGMEKSSTSCTGTLQVLGRCSMTNENCAGKMKNKATRLQTSLRTAAQ